jgi:hypothetical protein
MAVDAVISEPISAQNSRTGKNADAIDKSRRSNSRFPWLFQNLSLEWPQFVRGNEQGIEKKITS